jgi:hypothetical protein
MNATKPTLPSAALPRRDWMFVLLLLVATSTSAQTVYKCTGANGSLSYQDTPCARTARQKVMVLHASHPAPVSTAPAAPRSTIAAAQPTPAKSAPPPQVTPLRTLRTLPQLYDCVNAVNGKVYVSRNGHPASYLAPLGMLGAFQTPLAQTYGGKDAARRAASDPQLAHGRITQGLVTSNYTRVQDRCRPLSPREICEALGNQLQQLETKIDKSFRSDRPPMEEKAARLRKEQAACRP